MLTGSRKALVGLTGYRRAIELVQGPNRGGLETGEHPYWGFAMTLYDHGDRVEAVEYTKAGLQVCEDFVLRSGSALC